MKYPRLSRFTRFTSRYQRLSERQTHKTVVPRFRKRSDLSGCLGDTTTSRFFRLFLFSLSRFRFFLVAAILLINTTAFAQVLDIPDPNLEKAIREELLLPDGQPITQQEMLGLTWLSAWDSEITSLTGLEYAIYLVNLGLCGNQIQDLQPIAGLIHLKQLSLCGNQISDISPLANLTNLIGIDLNGNKVSDITPLANLTELDWLSLNNNSIEDISPLANLINLQQLWIRNNFITDITPLLGLDLTVFEYDEACDISPLLPSVRERIENRSFPSTFIWGHFVDLEQLRTERPEIRHDLIFGLPFWLKWQEPYPGLSTRIVADFEQAREERQRALEHTPNLILLRHVDWYTAGLEQFPPDSEFWLRDENGQIVFDDGMLRDPINQIFYYDNPEAAKEYQIDFAHPGFQDLLVERIVAIANCGLFDGIVFDGFVNNATLVGRRFRSHSAEEVIAIITNILSRVRSRVHEDFLILANANRSKLTAYAEHINGAFMETATDYSGGYTPRGLREIEDALLWNEANLREPRINCLAGYSTGAEPPDSPTNRRWMRLFTTMGLTHSDGYVLYFNVGIYDHTAPFSEAEEYFYPFWETDLGRPIGPTAQQYQSIYGLFIREFTNGWAVYNRSGKPQTISLPQFATGVSSRKSGTTHLLPDFDGEMYLKAGMPIDLNDDGVINILDLIAVSQAFGTKGGDVNGDGTTNILDLTLVAQYFQ